MGHFFKMMIWLAVMAVVGFSGLVLINHYSKSSPDGEASIKAVINPPKGIQQQQQTQQQNGQLPKLSPSNR